MYPQTVCERYCLIICATEQVGDIFASLSMTKYLIKRLILRNKKKGVFAPFLNINPQPQSQYFNVMLLF